jgi:hypothetical protein
MGANDILYSGLGDQRLTEELHQEILLARADRSQIINHPALMYLGDLMGRKSTTVKASEIGLDGYDGLAAVAEGASVTTTAMYDASYTVTVARQSKKYAHTDLAKITDHAGQLDPARFAQDATITAGLRTVDLIADLVGGFSNEFGSTGVNITIQQFFDAGTYLEGANVQGPFMAILHSKQWADLRDAVRTATGLVEWQPASAAMQEIMGTGYKGRLWGVDIFVTNRVPTANAGADRAGGMFGRGAILWADASIPNNPAAIAINAGKAQLELSRDADASVTSAITNYYLGANEGEDARGASLTTDA